MKVLAMTQISWGGYIQQVLVNSAIKTGIELIPYDMSFLKSQSAEPRWLHKIEQNAGRIRIGYGLPGTEWAWHDIAVHPAEIDTEELERDVVSAIDSIKAGLDQD